MKTLDEVIAIMDGIDQNCTCCAYQFDCDETECVENDALHYLKEFKELSKMWNDRLDKENSNPPLNWDGLKGLVGKPVWVEVYDPIDEKTGWHTASWKLIEFINDEYFDVRDSDGEQECFYKSENDCYCWQAYRKERR